ncbi:MAG: hypothetical protein ACRCYU_06970 [Nocardioides sp.]
MKIAARLELLQRLPERRVRDSANEEKSRTQIQFRVDGATRTELADAYLAGSTVADLQVQYGLGKESVRKLLAQADVPTRRNPLSEVQLAQAIELYESGLSVRQVGAAIGVPKTTIRDSLARAGVQMRPARRVARSPADRPWRLPGPASA